MIVNSAPLGGGRPGCIRLTADKICEVGFEKLHNAIVTQAIKDFMKGFKYTHRRKKPKKPVPRNAPEPGASAKEVWKYHHSIIRFKIRFEKFKRWHESYKRMIDAEKYFRSEEFASETDYKYNPDEIIERMKRKIRHMSYKNIEEGTKI